jgi:hypothetical protein
MCRSNRTTHRTGPLNCNRWRIAGPVLWGLIVLMIGCGTAPPVAQKPDDIEHTPWVTGDTLHVYLCCARGLQAGEIWHGYLSDQPEPFLWAAAYTGQYVLNFGIMTGIPFVPSLPCTLVFRETGGRP